MTSIIATQPFELSEGNLFQTKSCTQPTVKGKEVLIKVQASGVNPIDTKTRKTPIQGDHRILGYEGAGIVEKVGETVEHFQSGDKIMYVSAPKWQGSNQTYQVLEEDYIALMPDHLSYVEAASLPLTAYTAYETLFDIFGIHQDPNLNQGKVLLIINGAGGVGSIATQIAKAYGLTVITTASRDKTIEWSKKMGADYVLNHRHSLEEQFEALPLTQPDYIFCTYDTDHYYQTMIDLIKPRGHIATIVAFKENQDLNALKAKSVTFTHESMFTRLTYGIETERYREYLQDVTLKLREGTYIPTLTEVLEGLTSEHVFEAHQKMEAQAHVGKLVINVND